MRDKAWPKSARWLWRRVNEVLPLLVAVGIEAVRDRDESGTTITLRRTPRNDASDASEAESGKGKRNSPGIKDEANASFNARNQSNASSNASENPAENAGSGNTGNRFGNFSETPASDYDQLVEERMTELNRCTGKGDYLCDACVPI